MVRSETSQAIRQASLAWRAPRPPDFHHQCITGPLSFRDWPVPSIDRERMQELGWTTNLGGLLEGKRELDQHRLGEGPTHECDVHR